MTLTENKVCNGLVHGIPPTLFCLSICIRALGIINNMHQNETQNKVQGVIAIITTAELTLNHDHKFIVKIISILP